MNRRHGSTQGSASCSQPLGVSHARPRGDCLGLRYPNSDWMDWACQSSRMFAFQQQNKARPDKSTKTCTTPLHMGWTQAMPYRSPWPCPRPRHAALCYLTAIPCHAMPINIPSIPTISWPVWPAEACHDIYRQTARSHSPTALTSVPGYTYLLVALCVGTPTLVVAPEAVSSSHPPGQVSMLTVQGSQKIANLGVGDSPALHGRKSKQPTDTAHPPVCMSVASLWSPSTLSWPSPTATPLHLQSNLQTHAQSF